MSRRTCFILVGLMFSRQVISDMASNNLQVILDTGQSSTGDLRYVPNQLLWSSIDCHTDTVLVPGYLVVVLLP